ncbi:hypothetical protein NA56DRAFT_705018 [Hyaloscypha hepaticicola]|uniref:Protein kinase domain-containing protein n=1 Tax=Hyaloscypha hepaticicola TaxID=2082293 RepID=A0A2J6Q1W3_9HELO|nr:hypothetical protein NA56DRAFT_705018 [Hyaloscypha hepaticicola]
MAAFSTSTDTPSISELYGECIQSFGRFILALSEKDCCVIRLEQVYLPEILEEYGRTKIWGDQAKADLPARARGSLDDTLRHEDELKHLVQAILTRLSALLGQGKEYDPAVGSDHDSISSVSTDSDSGLDDDGEYQRQRMPKIRLLTQQMLEQIRSLYDLSSLLRRPKIADKYIRSINSKSYTATLSDSDTLPLSVAFSSSDESHVAEKVLQWRGLTKNGRIVEFKDEDVAPVEQGLTSDWVEDILWFCQRLARANTRRREQLQYWTDHPYDPKQGATNAARHAIPDLAQVPAKQEKQESRSQASTLKPPDPNLPREGPGSAVSKQSFSTAAVSDIHDTKTDVRPRTVYAPTAIGQGRSNSVPDLPKTAYENATFPCPYCGMTLESSEMQMHNKQSWKRHVFRDLRPYVCTFEDCQNAGKLYVSRHDWIYHELQIHRREYVCKECHKTYSNRKEISTHLRGHYGESISPAQLGVILDLCDHQVDVSNNEKDSCLICGDELSLSALQGHLAAHMEDIALFILPNTDEEEETGGSKASVQAAKLKSKGKTSYTESEASNLGFSATGSNGQTPAEFAKILTREEVGYASKFSSWRTTDEDQKLAPATWTQIPSKEDERAELEVSHTAGMDHKEKDNDVLTRLSLYSQLKYSMLESPLDGQGFLPLNILDELITKESVKAQLSWKTLLFQSGLPNKIVQHAKKVFAILVLMDKALAITELLSEGLTDEHLPLGRKGDNSNILVSIRGKTFESFDGWGNDALVGNFLDKQWLVQAEVLDTTGKHFVLNPKCPLPFPRVEEIGGGHLSTVYRAALHPAYLQGFKAKEDKFQVAIKEFRIAEPFNKERGNLKTLQNLHHQHLIQHFASYENGRRYYIIFPLADGGNLREFWALEDSRQRTPELALWSLQQMLGVAGALKALHSVNYRHGDLKPEHILHFKGSGEGILVIAGVGRMSTVSNMNRTATTPSYEPPEVFLHPDTPRSRKYDIWTLGCLFLDFTIWLLHGFQATNDFDYGKGAPNFNFYKLTPDGIAETHPAVYNAIDALQQDSRCEGGTALEALVNLIAENLLQVAVDRRHTAADVYDKLQMIVQDAEKTPSYLFNRVDSPPAMPSVFRRK